jgi:hypothetical protein
MDGLRRGQLMRVLPLDGGDLEGSEDGCGAVVPARIKQDFQWRTGFLSRLASDDQPR